MTDPIAHSGLQLLSLVTAEGKLEVSLVDQPIADPRDDQVVVKVLATPINPSDLGLLFGAGDLSTAQVSTRDGHPLITADVPAPGMRAMAGRIAESMPVGNEGSGVVIAAGASAGGAGAARQDRRDAGRGDVRAVSHASGHRVHGPARWHRACRRRIVLRQPADRLVDDRGDAPRRP